jgi:hypothetical protein
MRTRRDDIVYNGSHTIYQSTTALRRSIFTPGGPAEP